MTDITHSPRFAPRALLVEGDCADAVGAVLRACRPDMEPVRVSGFLAAMGELNVREADVVIGPVSALTGMAAATARCLRRLAPQAKLFVVSPTDRHDDARAAVAHGFDGVIVEPIDPATLAAALGITPARLTHDTPDTPEPSEAPKTPAPPDAPESPLSVDVVTGGADADGATLPTPAVDAVLREDAVSSAEDDMALGDVDLVEAMLKQRHAVLPIALRIITAQSGIQHVTLTVNAGDVPVGHAQAAVNHDGQCFGHLHAPKAQAVELTAWAAWLGRWLALHGQMEQLDRWSNKDELTGVWNRRYFNRFLEELLEKAGRDRSQVTLMVFDIDDFKTYNDRYGHAAGDEILREAAKLMASFVRDHDVVARIGGDEFAVIFWDAGTKRQPDSQHPDTVRHAARRFQQAICSHRFPKLSEEAPGTLTISGGLASFPWDGRTPAELLSRADTMAIQSKRQGKNAITFGPGALHLCGADLGRTKSPDKPADDA